MKILMSLMMMLALASCDNKSSSAAEGTVDSTRHLVIMSSDGKRHDFKIELALTAKQQEIGLMNRTEMAKDAGMLFFFAGEADRAFWMKNTLIPLDMIFIKKDGTIANIHENAVPQDLTSISSDGPVMAVLELNGGVSKDLKIVAGDKVYHPFFGNEMR